MKSSRTFVSSSKGVSCVRVALRIIMTVGTSQARLMLGFMITTMFLSMWISNTATTAMMLPIVDAVAEAINSKVDNKHICLHFRQLYITSAKVIKKVTALLPKDNTVRRLS